MTAAGRTRAWRARSASPLAWLGALLVLYLVVPLVAFVVRLAGSHQRGFGIPGLWGALRTSVEAASISTVLIAVVGIPLAYKLAAARGPLAGAVTAAVALPLALPPVMSGVILVYLVGPYTFLGRLFGGRLTDSLAGIVIAQTFVAAPFLLVAARSAFAAVDPALYDVAATLGHRPLGRFLGVAVPAASGGITAGLLLTWLRAFGEYGATVLLAYHPYSLPVYTYVQFSGAAGIPATQAPTALALGVAAVAAVVARARFRPALRRRVSLGPAQAPPPTPPVAVGFDLHVAAGEFDLRLAHRAGSHRLAILGPSGSGKSLTLRSLAGLMGPGAGAVTYGAESVGALPAEERAIGYVPQGSGLFPGRSVREQVLFGVGADPSLAAWWLGTLGLGGLEDRLPGELSGGQRQRVGLAQALARNPRVLFLDEPFSGLDAPVRQELREELRRLQRNAGLSTVLVTHDPEEAAILADEVMVISAGRLLQAGPCREVFAHPASATAARLLGIRNVCHGRVSGPGTVEADGVDVAAVTDGLRVGTPVLWCVRPEEVVIDAGGGGAGAGGYPAAVEDAVSLGALTEVSLLVGGRLRLRSRRPGGPVPDPGGRCRVTFDPAAVTVWVDTERSGDGVVEARR